MKKIFLTLLLAFAVLLFSFGGSKTKKLKPVEKIKLNFNEPSDICTFKDCFLMPGNKAFLFQTNSKGIEKKIGSYGLDLEGICTDGNLIYLLDETARQVFVLNQQFEVTSTKQLHYSGATNLGFESITYNEQTQHFFIGTEKSPQLIIEFDKEFNQLSQFSLNGIREVSAMTIHNGSLWILSDEMHQLFEVDVLTKKTAASWMLPIINPEGLCFSKDNKLIIVSDDMNTMFVFNEGDLK